jgi:hypothetical protein
MHVTTASFRRGQWRGRASPCSIGTAEVEVVTWETRWAGRETVNWEVTQPELHVALLKVGMMSAELSQARR